MLYHVFHTKSHEFKTLLASDILDMDYDANGRVIVAANDGESYFLLASKDVVSE